MNLNFRKAESVYMLIFLAFGGLLFQQSYITKVPYEEPLTARVYGMIISSLFIITVISRLFVIVAKREAEDQRLQIKHAGLILVAMIAILAYTIGIIKVGYYVVTFVYTVFMIMLLREKEQRTKKAWITTVLGCLAFDVALYAVFTTFHVFLPNAWLI